jgi:hypothetical protein
MSAIAADGIAIALYVQVLAGFLHSEPVPTSLENALEMAGKTTGFQG